ncbi:ABC transporter permease [Oceanobacillus sp. CAU 1775]
MTGWRLFRKRLIDDYIYQKKVIRIAVDWIILLYTALPAIVLGTIFYIDIWRNITSYLPEFIPLGFIINLIFLLSLHGSYRTFMFEADILFLLNREKLYRQFRKQTFLYSLSQLLLSTAGIIILFLPFLMQGYDLLIGEVALLYIILIGYRMMAYTLKKVIKHVLIRWSVIIILLYIGTINLVRLASFGEVALVSIVIISILTIYQLKTLIPTKRFFFQEVASENKARVRYAKLILGMATEVEKTPISFGKRPWFLRKSRRFFRERTPENGLLELLFKGFIRNPVLLGSYMQIISPTLFGILILPIWMKWLLLIIAILFLQYNSWLRGLYEKLLDQPVFYAIPIDTQVQKRVWPKFKRWLMVPAISVLGFATILQTLLIIIGG